MLNNLNIQRAVTSLLQRAERQDDQKILETFVDSGIISQLNNRNNQIVFGRRGTGKTHIFRYLAGQLRENPNNTIAFLDARTLGSTSQFSDPRVSIPKRCISIYRDIINEINNVILEQIVSGRFNKSEEALGILSELMDHTNKPIASSKGGIIEGKETESTESGADIGMALTFPVQATFNFNAQNTDATDSEYREIYRVDLEDKIVFSAITSSLNKVLTTLDTHLYILFDEWASIPLDIQAYLAEFLKRSFLPVNEITLKIASLEYRSEFGKNINNIFTGFELGSDISASLDLDDYYVFDRNPNQVTAIMADILFKHLKSELPENNLEEYFSIKDGDQLSSRLFTQRPTFQELVRASEGVVRDFINIFIKSFFEALRHNRTNIDQSSIIEAARYWFETDKKQNLDDKLHGILSGLIEDVIGQRKARSFLAPRELERHPYIQQLADARILHLIRRGYSDKENAGIRYNIYTLDYGTYVDLIHTSKEPEIDMPSTEDDDLKERIVPFDDKRSIRRIILTPELLDIPQ